MSIFEDMMDNAPQMRYQQQMQKKQMDFEREQMNSQVAVGDQTLLPEADMKSDLIKWQQNLDDEFVDFLMTLRGYARHEDSWVPTKQRLCNDAFIGEVVKPMMRPYLSRNLINSNFTEKRILADLRATCNDMADAMSDGYDRYDIAFENYDIIMRNFKNTVKASAFRALNGWTKKTDNTVTRRLETMNEAGRGSGEDQKMRKSFLFGNK